MTFISVTDGETEALRGEVRDLRPHQPLSARNVLRWARLKDQERGLECCWHGVRDLENQILLACLMAASGSQEAWVLVPAGPFSVFPMALPFLSLSHLTYMQATISQGHTAARKHGRFRPIEECW